MNDTMRLDVRSEVDTFVAAVEARLADLTTEERDELVGGLRADLTELLAEHDGPESATEVLGDPATYAAELRTAAGFAPVMAVRRGRRPVALVVTELLDAAGRAWAELVDKVPGSPRGFLETLQPVWWVLRAWVAWMLVQDLRGWDHRVSYQPVWLVVLAVLGVGSVQLGRGAVGRMARVRAHVAGRLALLGLNVLAVCLVPASVDRTRGDAADDLAEQRGYVDSWAAGYEEPAAGLMYDGVELTNLFAYDAAGRPLTGVQLFDAEGRPLVVNEDLHLDDYTTMAYPWFSRGTPSPRFNVFPLPVGQVDPDTGERDPDAWESPEHPVLPAFPFAAAPPVELPDVATADPSIGDPAR